MTYYVFNSRELASQCLRKMGITDADAVIASCSTTPIEIIPVDESEEVRAYSDYCTGSLVYFNSKFAANAETIRCGWEPSTCWSGGHEYVCYYRVPKEGWVIQCNEGYTGDRSEDVCIVYVNPPKDADCFEEEHLDRDEEEDYDDEDDDYEEYYDDDEYYDEEEECEECEEEEE